MSIVCYSVSMFIIVIAVKIAVNCGQVFMSSTEAKAARIPQPPPAKKYCLVYIKSYFSYISYVSLQNPCAIGVLRLSGLIIKILFFERKILFSYVPRHIVELRAGILPLWTPSSPFACPLFKASEISEKTSVQVSGNSGRHKKGGKPLTGRRQCCTMVLLKGIVPAVVTYGKNASE